ncbi:MAG TPA: LacI family DNA-binding transcriptional regulator [Anaerolineaceae bacterium]
MVQKPVRKATIKDIAQRCNVSTQTVSRVINNRPDVAPETRKLVEQAIADMDYRPSALARSLVQRNSYMIGVITAGLRYIGVSTTLDGITDQCDAAGYALLLKELPRYDTPTIVPIIESLMSHQVEGIIFAAPELNENVKITQSQLPPSCPPIIFLKCNPNPNYTTISVDNVGGAQKATQHLLSCGRRHVGLITGPLEWLEARQRKQGWESALRSQGIQITSQKWTSGNWSAASGETAFAELVQKYPRMDAVFTSNDQMAFGALHYAHSHNIRVPEDIAIIGFDDLRESAYLTPALSSVTHPLRQMGTLAVDTLLEIINSGGTIPNRTIVLETELVLRDSTPQR